MRDWAIFPHRSTRHEDGVETAPALAARSAGRTADTAVCRCGSRRLTISGGDRSGVMYTCESCGEQWGDVDGYHRAGYHR